MQGHKSEHLPYGQPRSHGRSLDPDTVGYEWEDGDFGRFLTDGEQVDGSIVGDEGKDSMADRSKFSLSIFCKLRGEMGEMTNLEKSGAEFPHQNRCLTLVTGVSGTPSLRT